jgi:hypothetical protein
MRCKPRGSSHGRADVAALVAAVVVGLFVGIPAAQAKGPAVPPGREKKEMRMQFPSYDELPMSPHLDKPGIKVLLGAASFKANEPVTLYGAVVSDSAFYDKCRGEEFTWIMVIAVARDMPGVWSMPVLTKPNLAPIPPKSEPLPDDPSFRHSGFFNLDLRQHLQLPEQPSRYWLIVTMGDYKTDILSFELK